MMGMQVHLFPHRVSLVLASPSPASGTRPRRDVGAGMHASTCTNRRMDGPRRALPGRTTSACRNRSQDNIAGVAQALQAR